MKWSDLLFWRPKGWTVDFKNGIPASWMVADWDAPMGGKFNPMNAVVVNGILRLKLSQVKNPDGTILSTGAELQTKEAYGFGTYEFTLRAGSTATTPDVIGVAKSGGISAGFIFVNDSETEIDFEVESQYPKLLTCTSYKYQPVKQTKGNLLPFNLHDGFHTYKMVWTSSRIDFYIDGVLKQTNKVVVPTRKAFVLLNHWGTNDPYWGGLATLNVDRFMYVSKVSYTP